MNSAEEARNKRITAMTDVALLRLLIVDVDLTDAEHEAFMDMIHYAENPDPLTKKQRKWAEEVARRVVPLDANETPLGKEVPTPEVLKNLPLKPPGRQ